MNHRWSRHMIATESSELTPASCIARARALVRWSTSSKVSVPSSSMMAGSSGYRSAPTTNAAAGVSFQPSRTRAERSSVSGRSAPTIPERTITSAARASCSGRLSWSPTAASGPAPGTFVPTCSSTAPASPVPGTASATVAAAPAAPAARLRVSSSKELLNVFAGICSSSGGLQRSLPRAMPDSAPYQPLRQPRSTSQKSVHAFFYSRVTKRHASLTAQEEDFPGEEISGRPRAARGVQQGQPEAPVVRDAHGGAEGAQPAVAAARPARYEPVRHRDADPHARSRGAAAGGAHRASPGWQVERPRGRRHGVPRNRVHPQRQPQADQAGEAAAPVRPEPAGGLARAHDPR